MIEQGLLQVLEKIYQERGFDFRQYKESSLRRRIERRLRATKVDSYKRYLEVLDSEPDEYKRLIDDLTIKVTEFFRDSEAWQVIAKEILPQIINGPSLTTTKPMLRVWSAGCATGQEVYSMAILLARFLEEGRNDYAVKIWGTDIDKESLLKAEQAEYKSDMIKSLPQDILDEYFDFNGNFRVKSSIRDGVYFKFHDLVLDEPLRQMDLILCRNVAIYFERMLQEKIFMDFYNALNSGGYLFLGKAETLIGEAQEKFRTIDKHWRICQKII